MKTTTKRARLIFALGTLLFLLATFLLLTGCGSGGGSGSNVDHSQREHAGHNM